jgi:hypothetical protein
LDVLHGHGGGQTERICGHGGAFFLGVLKYLGHRKFGMLPVDLRRIVNHQKLFQVINKFMTFV